MKLTATCKICGRTIAVMEKDSISQDDMDLYQQTCSCEVDGPFQEYDDEGNPLPMDNSNIVVVKTLV